MRNVPFRATPLQLHNLCTKYQRNRLNDATSNVLNMIIEQVLNEPPNHVIGANFTLPGQGAVLRAAATAHFPYGISLKSCLHLLCVF